MKKEMWGDSEEEGIKTTSYYKETENGRVKVVKKVRKVKKLDKVKKSILERKVNEQFFHFFFWLF